MSDLALMIPLIGVSIPIVAILSGPLNKWIRMKEQQSEIAARAAGEEAVRYAARIERLESRVAVLERIATDRGTTLADEIDSLRGSTGARLN